ncbi:MAG: D-Ala-D-Ala carboxypeptidase family metallohydrolase [Gammaproteobacteria bacterium]|nr:D-Ala-D-Ala carboxypeptidase family metallohydrolase [Gammaproteobacteria bacterium]
MDRIKLSDNFYLDEFTRSQTAVRHGIDMSVIEGGLVYTHLRRLCKTILQPVRDELGPVHISSGYRPSKLNKLIGGSSNSAHCNGKAADITVSGYTPLQVAQWIDENLPNYDQVIHEFGQWVHVSISGPLREPRGSGLTAVKVPRRFGNPKTVYIPYILSIEDALKRA